MFVKFEENDITYGYSSNISIIQLANDLDVDTILNLQKEEKIFWLLH